ncbi:ABC transporter permease subunit [Bifidobacterium sp. SMB2]|uniref:ABC transporter permease subunit n=1 Tax=Bifidobacterium saimiriisciurei TaxID=2661627 RepID=A0ABX0CC48_9BIFI|nr:MULTISPECIES: ABC transporter permease [Bifidobacterium]NEG96683.1 ABC transporter permease subunit [Bifidobacterium sp. SMB2]NEH11839.1 ABC transporter permease subunit [Bifidobacterium saimiriisciurei]
MSEATVRNRTSTDAKTSLGAIGAAGNKPTPARKIEQLGAGQATWRRLRHDKASMIALGFIVLLVLMAVFAPALAAITGHDPAQQYREIGLTATGLPTGPGKAFWFGADQLGRDELVRIAYGARVSLLVGVVASMCGSLIAVVIGVLAGYFGGWVDNVLSRITDFVMTIPFLLCALALVSVFGASIRMCLFVVIFFSWAVTGRVIRAQVQVLKKKEFVEAARSLGASDASIIVKDILPNLTETIIVYTTQGIPSCIVFEASLSFLGMGIVPPTPSWGGMLSEAAGNSIYMVAPWLVFFPGLFLLMTTLSFNILGDGLRDALDPKAGRRMLARKRKRKGAAAVAAVAPVTAQIAAADDDIAAAKSAEATSSTPASSSTSAASMTKEGD